MTTYRAKVGLSIRAKPDRGCEEWLDWGPGDTIADPPPHLPLKRLLAKGQVEVVGGPAETQTDNDGEEVSDGEAKRSRRRQRSSG